MNQRVAFHGALASLLLLACSCGAYREVDVTGIPATELTIVKDQDPVLTNLMCKYQEAQDQFGRRAVCLQAIDKGVIRRGVPVASIDQIFSTNFEPARKFEGVDWDAVHFEPDLGPFPTPEPGHIVSARGFFGWYLVVEYDGSGTVQNYFISNINKGDSHGERGKTPSSIAELAEAYATAKSESERRDICLRAIDEGVIATWPVSVSAIDTIFGTHLASQLPTRREDLRTVRVYFGSPASSSTASVSADSAAQDGWFLAVQYDHHGHIEDYYLTNAHK